MKYLLVLAGLLIGCGAPTITPLGGGGTTNETVVQQSVAAPLALAFGGYYVLPNGGYTRVDQDALGLNDVNTLRLVYNNVDGSQGLIPVGQMLALPVVNNNLYYNNTLNYPAANNVKQDSNNVVLVGNFWTEVVFYKTNSNLYIHTTVSSANGTILFDHIVTQQ